MTILSSSAVDAPIPPIRPLPTPLPSTVVVAVAVVAATAPSLLAYSLSPSPTFLNQALALAAWGSWVVVLRPAWRVEPITPLLAALALVGTAAAVSAIAFSLPWTLAASGTGALAAAAVLALAGAGAGGGADGARPSGNDRAPDSVAPFVAFAWGWLVAGLANAAIGLVQVFWPEAADGTWLAASGPGRAVGNLRQPNHLSSLLLWGGVATVALLEMRRLALRWAAPALALLVFAVVLTASRTGLVSVLLLAAWGVFDRKLSRPARVLLVAAPLVYAAGWAAMAEWARMSQHAFGGAARLAETDISGSRFGIWGNTLALIGEHPWTGVGFGNFNFAWTLTEFPGRPTAFFDHTHNLPLQLAVELGLPLAALVLALLVAALVLAARRAWRMSGDAGTAARAALAIVVMVGLHSLLEYPLWYAYFLLPTAWAWGWALRTPPADAAPRSASSAIDAPSASSVTPAAPTAARRRPAAVAALGATVVVAAVFTVWDYARVTSIFRARDGDAPLAERIARGQASVFFGHHADYAEVTSGVPVADPARAFDRVTHYLLDTRLMVAWARSLADRGDVDAARHVAARLREFNRDGADDFFAACPHRASAAPASELPFQCALPQRTVDWRELLSR